MPARDFLNWDQIYGDYGDKEVGVHLHTPQTKRRGFPVYSVVHRGRSLGQTTSGALVRPSVKVDLYQLQEALNQPTKTRNTFVMGMPITEEEIPTVGEHERLTMRPGIITLGDEDVFRAKTGSGIVTIRENIPSGERVSGGPTSRQSQPFRGVTVPRQSNRSNVFADYAQFGPSGVRAYRGRPE